MMSQPSIRTGPAGSTPAGSRSPDEPGTPGPPGPPEQPEPDGPIGATRRTRGEPFFRSLFTTAGVGVLVIIVAIAVFLVIEAIPALRHDTANFFTEKTWFPDSNPPKFGIAAVAFGTLVTAVLALIMAMPVAIGIALFLSHYAPRRLSAALGFVVDLLAAVPSVIFGLWGRDYLRGPVTDLSGWLHDNLGWIPLFGSRGPYGSSLLLGSIVLAIMVLPITTALCRDVFRQTPTQNEEAALALGATRWEMIRTAVLPFGRPGVVAAVMLGLGRALGETIALAMTLGSTFVVSLDLIQAGGNSIAANIANNFNEATPDGRGALIASGLVLFAITLVVNVGARAIVYRRRQFMGAAS